jgi:myo-inositol-1(or 4)-monophosphatase
VTGLHDLRDAAVQAAEAAAEVVRRSGEESVVAEVKGEGDYVTRVDRAAEAAAVGVLRLLSPGIPVVGEEGGGVLDGTRCWVVDPVDGTTNLLRRFPIVGVSVALVEDAVPLVGAVVAPLLGVRWWAIAGGGAFDGSGRPLELAAHRGHGVVSTGFPFRRKDLLGVYLPVMSEALRRFEDLRRTGAASLDLAYTAAGVWDGFFELGLSAWDIAAGTLLVREAGGLVTDWRGDERALFDSGDILAGTPQAHAVLLDIARAQDAVGRSGTP